MTRYVIFDCDGGSDDAWALLTLLKAEQDCDLKLLGVTITGDGNTTLEQAARNMLRMLRECKREDVPVYLGAVEALIHIPDQDQKLYFHGNDGFGDVLDPGDLPDIRSLVEPLHAVTAIWNLCRNHAKEVTVFSVGPLTNLALGYSMYGPEFGDNIKEIYIMGGNHQGVGNSTRAAEFNFHSDPEAAHAVLEKSSCPITILPWEACMEGRFHIHLNWRLEDFGPRAVQHAGVKLLNCVESAQWLPNGFLSWNPCDAMLIAVYLFDKQFVTKESRWHATVDLQGSHTRGQMVLDHLRNTSKYPENVRVIELVDAEFMKRVLEWVADLRDIKDLQVQA